MYPLIRSALSPHRVEIYTPNRIKLSLRPLNSSFGLQPGCFFFVILREVAESTRQKRANILELQNFMCSYIEHPRFRLFAGLPAGSQRFNSRQAKILCDLLWLFVKVAWLKVYAFGIPAYALYYK
ncbi:MAG: hypothetical protein CVV42_16800 [Candidatus Riflebacteria bacterium HGW-Riflebacteria-2]|jgi:hypothetical protein|nr:MAG: hypothetical protein CVV42_16800 [Candidatus Riflebacteria bacterium HGW-Riflebacteria-2]